MRNMVVLLACIALGSLASECLCAGRVSATVSLPGEILLPAVGAVPLNISLTGDKDGLPETVSLQTNYGVLGSNAGTASLTIAVKERAASSVLYLPGGDLPAVNDLVLRVVSNGDTIGEAHALLRWEAKIDILSFPRAVPAYGRQTGTITGVARDQSGLPLAEVPIALYCKFPDLSTAALHGVTDSDGLITFPLPGYAEQGTVEFQMIAARCVSETVSVFYQTDGRKSPDVYATIMAPRDIQMPKATAVPVTVMVSPKQAGIAVPNVLRIGTTMGSFVESGTNMADIALRDGMGRATLALSDFVAGPKIPAEIWAYVAAPDGHGGDPVYQPIGLAQVRVRQVLADNCTMLSIRPAAALSRDDFPGSVSVTLRDQWNCSMSDIAVTANFHMVGRGLVQMVVNTDKRGEATFQIPKAGLAGLSMVQLLAPGYASDSILLETGANSALLGWGREMDPATGRLRRVESYRYDKDGNVTMTKPAPPRNTEG